MWRQEIASEGGGRYGNHRVMTCRKCTFAIDDKLFDQASIRVIFGTFFLGELIRKFFKKFLKS